MPRRRRNASTAKPLLVTGVIHSGSPDGPVLATTRALIMVSDDTEGTQLTYVQSLDGFSFMGDGKQAFATYEVLPGQQDPDFHGPVSSILKGGMGCPVRENGVPISASTTIMSDPATERGFLMLSSDLNPGTPFAVGNLYEFELGRTFAFVPIQ